MKELAEINQLKRENAELRGANEILRAASISSRGNRRAIDDSPQRRALDGNEANARSWAGSWLTQAVRLNGFPVRTAPRWLPGVRGLYR